MLVQTHVVTRENQLEFVRPHNFFSGLGNHLDFLLPQIQPLLLFLLAPAAPLVRNIIPEQLLVHHVLVKSSVLNGLDSNQVEQVGNQFRLDLVVNITIAA